MITVSNKIKPTKNKLVDFIKFNNTSNLTKKPANGGIPLIENTTKVKIILNTPLRNKIVFKLVKNLISFTFDETINQRIIEVIL